MSLTEKIKESYQNTKEFLRKNKNALALGAALTFTPIIATATNNVQDEQQTQTEQTDTIQAPPKPKEELDVLIENYSHFLDENYDELTNFLKENLYAKSGHLYVLDKENPIRFVNDKPFFGIKMVGYNFHTDKEITGIFQDEHERSQSTTYSSMCNQGGCTPDQLIKIVSISNKDLPKENISILYKPDSDKFLSTVFTGPGERTDTRNRVIVNPEESIIYDHINWQRGTTAYVHPDVAFRLVGQDFKKAEQVLNDYGVLESQRHQVQQELEAQKDTLRAEKEQVIQERDSLEYQEQTRRRTTGGFGGFVTSTSPFNEDINLSYSIKTGREFGDRRREAYIIGTFNPGRTTQEIIRQESDVVIDPVEGMDLSALSKYEIDHTKTTTSVGTNLAIGIEVLGNLSLIGGVNYTEKNTTEKFRHMNETYFVGGDGVPINPDRWEIIEDNTTKKKEFGPVAGLGYDFGRLSVKGIYNFRQNELGLGVLYNIRNRRDQPSTRINQTSTNSNLYNNGGEQ